MADFIRFHNHERYHEGIANVAPADVYYGRREAILQRRAAQQRRTHAQRVRYNRAVRRQGTRGELAGELSVPRGLAESPRCWRRAVFPSAPGSRQFYRRKPGHPFRSSAARTSSACLRFAYLPTHTTHGLAVDSRRRTSAG